MKTILAIMAVLVNLQLQAQAPATIHDKPEMIPVKGGIFAMGDRVYGNKDELPVHEVALKDFKIGKTEVTVKQYRAFCKATGKSMPEAPNWGWQDDSPIVNVSWHDAVAYCDWLSENHGGLYRLPTEAEWEYAARGGEKSRGYIYSGSNDCNDVAWFDDYPGGKTWEVGRKKANELGIYDMSGNVWEWCEDWHDSDYYADSPSSNPRGPSSGFFRVLRGGSWVNIDTGCRVSERKGAHSSYRDNRTGFRVVLSQ